MLDFVNNGFFPNLKELQTAKESGIVVREVFRDALGGIYQQIAAGNAGEFYTPRAVTEFAVDMTNPRLGERILDPMCGTGGAFRDTNKLL